MRTLEILSPAELTVDTNVRKTTDLGTDFISSIREHGVLVPVVAHRTENGLHVLMGQRRTLASLEVGLESIPVYVVDSPEEGDRIAQQVIENDMRSELTQTDRADAYQQLSLIGMTPEKIAKRTGTKADKVANALKAKTSASGQQAMEYGIPFDMAARIAEFEEYPDLVSRLTVCANENPGSFEHEVTRVESAIAQRQAVAQKIAELEAEGHKVIDEGRSYRRLNRADGSPATEEDANAYTVSYSSWREVAEETAVIENWEELGFVERPAYSSDNRQSGPMTDEQKAERKQLIERNKLMDDATTTRKKFLVTLLSKKDLPKGYENLVANILATRVSEVQRADIGLICKMLGIETEGSWGHMDKVRAETGKSAKRAAQVMLTTALASLEKMMVRDCWRHLDGDEAGMRADYLTHLRTWGYTLSDVEKIVTREAE